ncbi:hypothetical protein C492_07735 [Natronococcus jeotgali DSM 18795]|uniref:Uncharacterized protein n=1 Tax=Natronococcus jeotgali DSM 18795 TaxID=1227498 RepID=L9XM41_9EURY|nr:hypothetical protein C492_07735 [Natronococcus jeotgali DSM 18795]
MFPVACNLEQVSCVARRDVGVSSLLSKRTGRLDVVFGLECFELFFDICSKLGKVGIRMLVDEFSELTKSNIGRVWGICRYASSIVRDEHPDIDEPNEMISGSRFCDSRVLSNPDCCLRFTYRHRG